MLSAVISPTIRGLQAFDSRAVVMGFWGWVSAWIFDWCI